LIHDIQQLWPFGDFFLSKEETLSFLMAASELERERLKGSNRSSPSSACSGLWAESTTRTKNGSPYSISIIETKSLDLLRPIWTFD
jgi:hypothetical protein